MGGDAILNVGYKVMLRAERSEQKIFVFVAPLVTVAVR